MSTGASPLNRTAGPRARRTALLFSVCVSLLVLVVGTGIGSVFVAPGDILSILMNKLFGKPLDPGISAITTSLVWNMRLPRVLLAFVVGAGLGASGTVMQSVLRNPLASSYTLGVSAGAALGAGIVMVAGFSLPVLGNLTLPAVGLLSGLLTVYLAVGFASRMDRGFSNNTIILAGLVFALFINAMLSLLASLNKDHMQRIALWQMGSFALKEWKHLGILVPLTLAGIVWLVSRARELDLIVFGEEQAQAMGVPVKRMKWLLLGVSAALTGSAVAFSGIIGFIDLIAPHVTRKIFGASHRLVVPLSALFGGTFMVVADLLARTLVSPGELQVGVVTAVIGAPFFAWVYFRRNRKGGAA